MTVLKSADLAEVEISYKTKTKAADRFKILTSKDSEEAFRRIWNGAAIEHREEMYMILLSQSGGVLGYCMLSSGGIAGTVADIRIILQVALLSNASKIILAHNHPSGNLTPSREDVTLTRKIKEGAALLDINLLDHLIMTADGFYSFADEGMI